MQADAANHCQALEGGVDLDWTAHDAYYDLHGSASSVSRPTSAPHGSPSKPAPWAAAPTSCPCPSSNG
eukprot:4714220-Amphidinium_carterae.1